MQFIFIIFISFLFSQSEFDPFTGERINKNTYFGKNNSISIGFLTNKSMNIIQYTKDIKLSDNIAVFGLIGFFNHFGGGLSWQNNYNNDGYMIGICLLKNNDYNFSSFAISKQWQFSSYPNYISIGIMNFYRFPNEEKIDNKHGWLGLLPIISYDYRF